MLRQGIPASVTVTAPEDRRELLERYGRFYGEHHFAIAWTATNRAAGANDVKPKQVTTPGWQFTTPLADAKVGEQIFGRGLTCNPAIVLRASGLIGLECDGEEDLLAIEQLELPETLTVRSSKPYKRHFYYRPPADAELLPFVAFRFETGKVSGDTGRYFIAPPAIHPTGAVYAFLPDRGPGEIEIATMPPDTYRDLVSKAEQSDAATKRHLHIDPDAKVRAGERRNSIFRYACALRRWSADKQEILEAALRWNDSHCDPPVDPHLVEMQVDGAMKMDGEQELTRALEAAPPDDDEPEPEGEPPPHDLHIEPDRRGDWTPIDLADPRYAIPPAPPVLLGLVYAGRRHIVSGPPESAKTLVAYILLLEALRAGRSVAVIDFEMGAEAARRLLDDLGASLDEIRSIYFLAPDTPPQDGMRDLIDRGTWLTIIDAAIGAYDASGLDDNARKDVQRFARTWIDPLWKANISSLLIDHVTKDKETRGKFTIGSERKLGSADIHLSLEAVKTLSRGETGLIKVHVHKDRGGYLSRPTTAVFELQSDPLTHGLTWQTRDPHPTDEEGHFRPTGLMEKVSRWLEQHPDGVTRNEVERNITGRAQYVRDALDTLTREEHIVETAGPNRARFVSLTKPYSRLTDPLDTGASPVRPSASRTHEDPVRPVVPPPKGDAPADLAAGHAQCVPPHDEETQDLIDKYVKPARDEDDGIPF